MSTNQMQHVKIEQITKCNRKDQDFLLRYLSRLPLTLKLDLEIKRKKTFYTLQQRYKDTSNEILSYAALILAVRCMYSYEQKFSSKQFDDMTLEEIRDVSMIKVERSYEKNYMYNSPKRAKLIHYWAVVKHCREHKPKAMSFIKISEHLKKFYNFSVGHNLISEMWRELEPVE